MSTLPDVEWDAAHSPDDRTGQLQVSADLPAFAGHFPGQPILPGIVQLACVLHGIAKVFPDKPASAFTGMSRLKFKIPVGPDTSLRLETQRREARVAFQFKLTGGSTVAEGILHYRE